MPMSAFHFCDETCMVKLERYSIRFCNLKYPFVKINMQTPKLYMQSFMEYCTRSGWKYFQRYVVLNCNQMITFCYRLDLCVFFFNVIEVIYIYRMTLRINLFHLLILINQPLHINPLVHIAFQYPVLNMKWVLV